MVLGSMVGDDGQQAPALRNCKHLRFAGTPASEQVPTNVMGHHGGDSYVEVERIGPGSGAKELVFESWRGG